MRQRPPHVLPACLLLTLAACAAPTSVVNLQDLSPGERHLLDAVAVFPLGTPPPGELGEVAPITGYACAGTRAAARDAALQQLRIKALQRHAYVVLDALVGPDDSGACMFHYGAVATGAAAAFWAVPPVSY